MKIANSKNLFIGKNIRVYRDNKDFNPRDNPYYIQFCVFLVRVIIHL